MRLIFLYKMNFNLEFPVYILYDYICDTCKSLTCKSVYTYCKKTNCSNLIGVYCILYILITYIVNIYLNTFNIEI